MLLNKLVLVVHWLHLSASALLIGGMVFLVTVLSPILRRNSSASGIGTLAYEIHERFRKYVGILIGVIILTGIINSFNSIITGIETSLGAGYITIIRIKVFLAICLFIIYGVNAFLIKEQKGDEDESCSCIVHPPLYKKILQIIALLLVFAILFLAVILRFL
ncbi:MAG: hypothetical protein ACE5KZ_11305 [Candidatus Scalinduaceae bacterium]